MKDQNDSVQDTMTHRIVAGLQKIGLAVKSHSWRRTGRAGVGPLQTQVLGLLRTRPGRTASMSIIAEELSVKLPTASEVVKTLEEKRLVRRRRSAADNRVVMVELSAKGAREGETNAVWPEFLLSAADQLDAKEQTVLLRSLMKLIKVLQEQGEIPVARICVTCRYFAPYVYADKERPHHCHYVNAPFGDRALRIDCAEHESAPHTQAQEAWSAFTGSKSSLPMVQTEVVPSGQL